MGRVKAFINRLGRDAAAPLKDVRLGAAKALGHVPQLLV